MIRLDLAANERKILYTDLLATIALSRKISGNYELTFHKVSLLL